MWFLARKEIRHARGRFALFVALVALIAFLVFVLTGLANGLGEATVSGVREATADRTLVAFGPGAQRSLGRSEIDLDTLPEVAAVDGVTSVAAIGQSVVNVTRLAATDTADASDTMPDASTAGPGDPATTVALVGRSDTTAVTADPATGLHAGDRVRLGADGPVVTVDAVEPGGSIQHAPVLTVPLDPWQRARYGTPDGVAPPARAGAVLVTTGSTGPETTAATADAVRALGLDPATPDEAVAATPGFAEETGTISLIRGFLLGIAALLVGTIFWVLTIQKEGPLAVLRASGARRGLLLRTYLLQVGLTVGAGIALGIVLAAATGTVLPTSAFALTGRDALTAAALLAALALSASAASLRRLLTVDPLTSLGRL